MEDKIMRRRDLKEHCLCMPDCECCKYDGIADCLKRLPSRIDVTPDKYPDDAAFLDQPVYLKKGGL